MDGTFGSVSSVECIDSWLFNSSRCIKEFWLMVSLQWISVCLVHWQWGSIGLLGDEKRQCYRWEKQMSCHFPAPACTFFQVTPHPRHTARTESAQSEQTFPLQCWMIRQTAQMTQIKFWLSQLQQEIALGFAAPGVALKQTITQSPSLGMKLEEGGEICATPILSSFLSSTLLLLWAWNWPVQGLYATLLALITTAKD